MGSQSDSGRLDGLDLGRVGESIERVRDRYYYRGARVGWKHEGKTLVGFIVTRTEDNVLVKHEASLRTYLVPYETLFPLHEV